MVKLLPRSWDHIRREWPVLTLQQRFETSVAFVVSAVILVAVYRLIVSVVDTLVLRTLNPLDHAVFQKVFGEIMTLLIALEFNHTLTYVITREGGIIQARIVNLIALLALARKVVVVDPYEVAPASLAALAVLVLALGVAYWFMREPEDAMEGAARPSTRADSRSGAG